MNDQIVKALEASARSDVTLATDPPVRGLVRSALAIVFVFLGGGFLWAALAPLSTAAIAPGVIKVDNNRKTVQHLDGGVIREILVREGSFVEQGQVLVRLDVRDADSDRSAVSGNIDALMAREARLVAQRDGLSSVVYPAALLTRRHIPDVERILGGQEQIFRDQQRAVQGDISVLSQRIEQIKSQIESVRAQVRVTIEQLPKYEEELRDVRTLFAKGLGLKVRVLDLERRVLGAKGDVEINNSKIAALQQQIGETEAQIELTRRKQARDVAEELREVQTKLAEAREAVQKFEARSNRGEILAPSEGVVMNLKYVTQGGVVPPGGAILDVVPRSAKLVAEIKLSPLDIEVLRPDLEAMVRLVAFKQRTTPVLKGRLVRVAPDATVDEKTGATFYIGAVEVAPEELANIPNARLYPGMPVEASIVTGERRVLDYIIQPITDGFARAFRED